MIEKEEGLPPALLGSCNDRAKQLHNSPSGLLKFITLYSSSCEISSLAVISFKDRKG